MTTIKPIASANYPTISPLCKLTKIPELFSTVCGYLTVNDLVQLHSTCRSLKDAVTAQISTNTDIKQFFETKMEKIDLVLAYRVSHLFREISIEVVFQQTEDDCLPSVESRVKRIKLDSDEIVNDTDKTEEAIQRIAAWKEEDKALDFRCLNLKTLPHAIGKLDKLSILAIDANKLKTLPAIIVLTSSNLQYLSMYQNKFETLPNCTAHLVHLQKLYANKNQIKSLPKNIGNLKKLEVLLLEDNSLSTLPESFGDLQNLKVLNISNNQFESLPDCLSKLTNLEKLHISGNPLKALPAWISDRPKLQLDIPNCK